VSRSVTQPGNGRFHQLALPGDEVLFVEDGALLGVVDVQRRADLAAALDGLLV